VGVSVLCPEWVRTNIGDAERNRPAEVAEVEPSTDVPELRPILEALVAGGIDPAEVAGRVVDAIHDGTFWIFTHDTTVGRARGRWDAIATGGRPDPWVTSDVPEVAEAAEA